MNRANFTIDNPLTNSKTKVIESDQETNGMDQRVIKGLWLFDKRCIPTLSKCRKIGSRAKR